MLPSKSTSRASQGTGSKSTRTTESAPNRSWPAYQRQWLLVNAVSAMSASSGMVHPDTPPTLGVLSDLVEELREDAGLGLERRPVGARPVHHGRQPERQARHLDPDPRGAVGGDGERGLLRRVPDAREPEAHLARRQALHR